MRTSSIGLFPAALSPSTTMECPLSETPSKRCFSIQVVFCCVLSAVIGAGFGMYEHAEQFRSGLLESDFKVGLDIVYAGERKIVGERAVAGDVEASANLLDLDVVHVDDFRKMRGD